MNGDRYVDTLFREDDPDATIVGQVYPAELADSANDEDLTADAAFYSRGQPRDSKGRFGSGGGAARAPDPIYKETYRQAQDKIAAAPVPSAAAVTKARAELEKAKLGQGRAGGDSRGGGSKDRARQRLNLFKEFGGTKHGYVACHGCGTKTHHAAPGSSENPHGYARFERGKIFTKSQGGGYQLPNLLPECFGCNRSRGDIPLREENQR